MPLPAGLMRKNSVAPPAFTPDFYVATDGSSANPGTLASPWSLAYALGGAGGALTAGKIVALRGGTYTGTFTSTVDGTAANPITFRQYPGERATISGSLTVFGSYVWLWGFEVVAVSAASGQTNGVQGRATGAKYINLIVHDAQGSGITLFDDSVAKPDQEAYGCLSYNNGNLDNNNHGFYANNASGYRKIRDCIAFNNWALGIQVYGTADNIHNITVDGNICFNNGAISGYSGGPTDLLVGGSVATGVSVTNNALYRVNTAATALNLGYYFGPVNQDLVCTGNYVYGLTEVFDWTTATVTGNTWRANTTASYALGATGQTGARGIVTGHTWNTNTWYGDATLTQWGYGPAGQVPGTAYSFANWKTQTGFTNPGSVSNTTPPNFVQVRANFYESGRANIVIYNWSGAANVSVDLSSVLSVGQAYTIVNAQDFFGTAVASGTYAGGSVSLPMAGIAAPTPIGRGVAGPTTGPTFQVFIVRLQGA